jgi:hypothetical protein
LEPPDVPDPVVVDELDPDEHADRPVAPSATAPPATAPRDRKLRRLKPLPCVTDFPHLLPLPNPSHANDGLYDG